MTCILPVAGIVFLLFCVLAANTPENIFQIYIKKKKQQQKNKQKTPVYI